MKYPITFALALAFAAPTAALAADDPKMMTQGQFDHLDTNNDGKVSAGEYRAFMDEAFGTFDANGDGRLSRDETRGVFNDDHYADLHAAGSGNVDRKTFLDRVMADFHRHDYNNDGHLHP